jgi:D-alanine-D-alanine ligase-like ATP-grasp enzyme
VKPIGIFYEHPEWFRLLFAELDRRGIGYEPIVAHEHRFDPSESAAPYSLVVNRVSASSYLRGHASAIFHARGYLEHLERLGVPVVNGTRAFALDTSKARQATLLAGLGLPSPRSRVVNHVDQIEPAAAELEYPIIVKPNLGGSGALMQRFRSGRDLREALATGALDGVLGLDNTAIVQEFHPPVGGSIVRVEALDGRFLYAIRIQTDPDQGFNICPADICQVDAATLESSAADGSAKRSLQIAVASPPGWVVQAVLQIFKTAGVDIGGVEYLESERDGQIYFYDINSLSNFVTDAPNLLGFDPTARFVDFIAHRAGLETREIVGVGS